MWLLWIMNWERMWLTLMDNVAFIGSNWRKQHWKEVFFWSTLAFQRFFTPHHVGRCCTDVIRSHCCATVVPTMGTLGYDFCARLSFKNGTSGFIVAKNVIDRQTDRYGGARKLFFVHATAWRLGNVSQPRFVPRSSGIQSRSWGAVALKQPQRRILGCFCWLNCPYDPCPLSTQITALFYNHADT
jgi:hypothetical protein